MGTDGHPALAAEPHLPDLSVFVGGRAFLFEFLDGVDAQEDGAEGGGE
jgi:hypothetical protein